LPSTSIDRPMISSARWSVPTPAGASTWPTWPAALVGRGGPPGSGLPCSAWTSSRSCGRPGDWRCPSLTPGAATPVALSRAASATAAASGIGP
jgi:hypothetical protein